MGRGLTRTPSTSHRLSISTGAKIPGNAELANIALDTGPLLSHYITRQESGVLCGSIIYNKILTLK
jgi:hypothetical protein